MRAADPLLPAPDPDAEPFWEGARRGELRVQRCAGTGRLFFPPRPFSPFAPHAPPRWETLSGRGSVWSWVVPHPPLLPAFAALAPYNVIVVSLAEDPRVRMVGNLVTRAGGSIAEIDPRSIRIGEPVRVVFETLDAGVCLPRWVRA